MGPMPAPVPGMGQAPFAITNPVRLLPGTFFSQHSVIPPNLASSIK